MSTCPIQFWWWLHYFCTLQDVQGRRSSRVVPIACGRIEERWRVFKYWRMKIFALDKHSVGSVIIIPRVFAQQLNDISPIGHYSATETSNASHERMVCVCWGARERAILLYAARLNYLGQHQLWGGYAMRVPLRKVDEIEPRSWVACCAWLQEKGPVRDITVVRI